MALPQPREKLVLCTSPRSSADAVRASLLTPAARAQLIREDILALAGELLELVDVVGDDECQVVRRFIVDLGGQWWA